MQILVKALLSGLALPDGVDRVAISLADPELGPFVLVTREGRFVTCLGEGMRVSGSGIPVVTRARFDGVHTPRVAETPVSLISLLLLHSIFLTSKIQFI